MRRTAAAIAVLGLAAALLVATPALAAFGAIVELPASEAYSPYGGPATVTFTFAGSDPATIFVIRLRQPGHGTIKEKVVLVDPALQTSPLEVPFSWKERSVTKPTDHVVDVRRQDGGPVITGETFTLLPPLVSDLSATPDPFYPLVQDGYKDDTTIRFHLAADTTATAVHVFADDAYGRCCGTEIRTEDLGQLPAGTRSWVWDGTKDDVTQAPKGTYFARIAATDTGAVSMLSKPLKVEVTKGKIRAFATKTKHGSAYSGLTGQQQTAIGGSCIVGKDTFAHEAGILCANAAVSLFWNWGLKNGERIESVSFEDHGGAYPCRRSTSHTTTRSFFRVKAPPTVTCFVETATIRYSYLIQA
jgi:hypothetical protein